MRVPPFFTLSLTFSHFVHLYLSLFPSLPFSLLCMRSDVHSTTTHKNTLAPATHLPNVASYFKCQESEFHFSNSILINPFKSH